jgi:hAT family C-terminal dimerisation region
LSSKQFNVFYNLPSLAPPKREDLRDELDRFLSTDPESVEDVLAWWYEKRHLFPRLSRMALDYLSIPGESYFHLLIQMQLLLI